MLSILNYQIQGAFWTSRPTPSIDHVMLQNRGEKARSELACLQIPPQAGSQKLMHLLDPWQLVQSC